MEPKARPARGVSRVNATKLNPILIHLVKTCTHLYFHWVQAIELNTWGIQVFHCFANIDPLYDEDPQIQLNQSNVSTFRRVFRSSDRCTNSIPPQSLWVAPQVCQVLQVEDVPGTQSARQRRWSLKVERERGVRRTRSGCIWIRVEFRPRHSVNGVVGSDREGGGGLGGDKGEWDGGKMMFNICTYIYKDTHTYKVTH